MDVAILSGTPDSLWVLDVGDIPEDDARKAGWLTLKSGTHSNGDKVWQRVVDMDVVGATEDRWLDVTSQVTASAVSTIECDRAGRIDSEELLHVENLDSVITQLTSNDHVVLVSAEFLPARTRAECCIGCAVPVSVLFRDEGSVDLQESQLDKLSSWEDLQERSTVVASCCDKLTSRLLISPTPRSGAHCVGATKLGHGNEGVQVHLIKSANV